MVTAEFKNSGVYSPWGYKRELRVTVSLDNEKSFYLCVGRDTAIAQIIEKYIIGEKFLWSGKRINVKELSDREWLLLKALKEAGTKYYALYFQALDEKMSWEDFEAQILWRIL